MKRQNYQKKKQVLVEQFKEKIKSNESLRWKRLKLSWSNWVFAPESLQVTVKRLQKNKIEWIELDGNRYGKDLGYKPAEVNRILKDYNIHVSGICGKFGTENDLSSNSGFSRQNAVDYLKRQIELCRELAGAYVTITPGAPGRAVASDSNEFASSAETLKLVGEDFLEAGIKCAVEPYNATAVSLVHSIADAKKYLQVVKHKAITHITGNIYQMQAEESNIAEAILAAGKQLVNLHLADSNGGSPGQGSIDIDAIIMALYCIDGIDRNCFVTPEILVSANTSCSALSHNPDAQMFDKLVADTAHYWREREEQIKTIL